MPPRILVLTSHASDAAARVRDILLATRVYAVSVERSAGAPTDLIIPIVGPTENSFSVLTELRASMPEVPLLPVFDETHLAKVLDRLPAGVTDFLVDPVRASELLARVRCLLPLGIKEETERVRDRLQEAMGLERMIGRVPAFEAVKQQILRVAKGDVTVLLTGETGTGKELTAQAIHYLSGRATKPFVPVNCGAIPPDLFENELFGHHRGAYTDARSHQQGLVAEAEGGTLFLDEVNSLTPAAQVKLLRFLEDRSYRPLGYPRNLKANVRLVAATNGDLDAKVREGTFREDLYYRLHVVTLRLPPLRERVGDIPLLAEYFLTRYAMTDNVWRFTPEALEAMCAYEWPGNVRELENVVRHQILMNTSKEIRATDLPWSTRPVEATPDACFRTAKAHAINSFERSYLAGLLETHRGNITRAAQAARQDRRTFRRLIQKHRLDPALWADPGKEGT